MARAIEDLTKAGDTYMYDVHSHPFDENTTDTYIELSEKDFEYSKESINVLISKKNDVVFKPNSYPSYEKVLTKYIVFYTCMNDKSFFKEYEYSKFSSAIRKIFKK